MPRSPYPGMDPYIERDAWTDFHTTFMTRLRSVLRPAVSPGYTANIERRVYIDLVDDEGNLEPNPSAQIADALVAEKSSAAPSATPSTSASVATATVKCRVPYDGEHRETYLSIRDAQNQDRVVTVIELLSPTNKRSGSHGRGEYIRKRQEILGSDTHFIEIDLLLAGNPPPINGRPPGGLFRHGVATGNTSER